MVTCCNYVLYLPVEQTTATDLKDIVLAPKIEQDDVTNVVKNKWIHIEYYYSQINSQLKITLIFIKPQIIQEYGSVYFHSTSNLAIS